MSQLFTWGGQSIGVSASASVLPMNTQDWSPLGWTGWISLQSKGLSRVFSNTTVQKHQFFRAQFSSQSNLHPYMTTGKTIALTRQTFVGKVMSMLLNMLSRLVITFLPRSKHLLISWLQSPSAVILEPQNIKSDTVSTVSPSISHEVMGPDAMILVFWMLSFKPTFWLSSFTFLKRLFSSYSLSAIRVVSSAYLKVLIFLPAILISACASSSHCLLNEWVVVGKQVVVYLLNRDQFFEIPWTIARQAPLSMGFPRQEHWSELLFPSQGIFPIQGSNLCLLCWQTDSLPLSHQGHPVGSRSSALFTKIVTLWE